MRWRFVTIPNGVPIAKAFYQRKEHFLSISPQIQTEYTAIKAGVVMEIGWAQELSLLVCDHIDHSKRHGHMYTLSTF